MTERFPRLRQILTIPTDTESYSKEWRTELAELVEFCEAETVRADAAEKRVEELEHSIDFLGPAD